MAHVRPCASCDAPFTATATGACSSYCLPCRNKANYAWKARKAAGQDTWICELCGETFQGQKRRFCSYDCRYEKKYGYRRHSRTKPPAWTDCLTCGANFRITHDKKVYCSRKCSARRNSPTETLIPWASCLRCRQWFVARDRRILCPACPYPQVYVKKPPRTGNCVVCGKPWTAYRGRPRLVCGARLCKKTVADPELRRQTKRRRRARQRNTKSERYRRDDIFERDKWRCQLCGKRTKRTKVVPHPMAPVIDHIIPISKDGDDIAANVQCAHFLCNSIKSDGVTAKGEQLRLIG